MKLSIFGLGYVGCVSAACFAKNGHEVIGVDVSQVKVDSINSGRSPVVEPGVQELLEAAVKAKLLKATNDIDAAVAESDISIVCVGTPGNHNGSLDLSYIKRVCQQIGSALESKRNYHLVVVRSTMLPGTIAETVVPTLEVYSGKRVGRDFGIAINPEFLREGTAVHDFDNPPFTLIGADDEDASGMLTRLYTEVNAPIINVGIREAEMVKYACNCFHALKVTFANEIGIICKELSVDSHKVMEVFCKDAKLNLSPYYLKPGFAFGGSCLPKDLRALTHKAKQVDANVPMLGSIMNSNQQQIERAVEMISRSGKKSVALLGLSFKANTDDLRESPMVSMVERLIGKGYKLEIYDREVELARLFGANKDYIEREIPHISSLMRDDLRKVIENAEVVIIAKRDEEFRSLPEILGKDQLVIDLVRINELVGSHRNYQGLCW